MTRRTAAPAAYCDHCGLPVAAVAANEPRYCCFGCRFAAAVAQESGDTGQLRWTLTRLGLAIFFSMNVMVFTLVLWSYDVYETPLEHGEAAFALRDLLRSLCLLLTAPVLLLLGAPLVENAWHDLRHGVFGVDFLMLLGVAAAFGYSIFSLLTNGPHVYFEVACMVLVVLTLGRWLEATGKLKTTEALRSLEKLLPLNVRLIKNNEESSMALESLQAGDEVLVLPGERIPIDGLITQNRASIDEQILTGESMPCHKGVNDTVYAGSLNLDGALTIRVSAPPSESTLQRLLDAVIASAHAPGRWQRAADRWTRWFLPAVVSIAVLTVVVHGATGGVQPALLAGLSVLLIACPCALGLATPMAVWAALGRAALAGVLFRDGDALARLAQVDLFCFDKTGTLTTGQPVVENIVLADPAQRCEVLNLAGALAAVCSHRLTAAITQFAPEPPFATPPHDVTLHPGLGVSADFGGAIGVVALGSRRFMEERGWNIPEALREVLHGASADERSLACLAHGGSVRAVFFFREQLRPEAAGAIQQLQTDGARVAVLSGDHAAAVLAPIAAASVQVHTGLLPTDKQKMLSKLGGNVVAMVGDGVNDAPALAAADVGIAMGCGADLSRDAADICLLGNDLNRLIWGIRFSRAAAQTIKWNLIWAFSYNTIGVLIAAAGWLHPVFAAIAMTVSSLMVVSNSLQLQNFPLPPSAAQAKGVDDTSGSQDGDAADLSALATNGRAEEFAAAGEGLS